MKSSAKRLLSVLIVLAMALSLVPVMAFAAGTTTTVYCQAPSGWSSCKAYWWGSKTGTNPSWPGVNMTKGDDGIWTYDVPSDATGLIFNNGSGTQTADLKVPTDENTMYVFQSRKWVAPASGPVEVVVEYFVAGQAALCGVDWNPAAEANKMSDADKDGVYTLTYTGVAAGNYEFKVTNGTWDQSWGQANSTANYKLAVTEADTTVEISFDSKTGLISVVLNGEVPTAPSTQPTVPGEVAYYVAGSFNGWTNPDPSYLMTANGDGTYSLSIDVAAGTVELKVTNGTWDDGCNWGDNGGNVVKNAETAGTIVVTFDPASGTVTVTGDCLGEVEEPEKTELVINSVHLVGAPGLTGAEWDPTANEMALVEGFYVITFENVAAGTYEFKFAANGTWDINWASGAAMESETVYDAWFNAMGNSSVTIPADGAKVTLMLDLNAMDAYTGEGAKCALVIEGVEIPDVPDVPVDLEYCLVGWINGADYGCNDDYQNVGEYIFVDGTLTTSFNEDSYIFVKSTDNANWYLTNAYTEETSATFVSGGSEKMKVPGGVELTFTLVVNEDGSVTVSYVAAAEPVLGATVSGAVVSGAEGDVTVELIAEGEVVASVTAAGKEGTYSIVDVAAGTYTLKVSQLNHVAREYTITVASENVAQDVKIHLIGDIDGNGKINMGDVSKLNAHLKGTNPITDEYMILCANVNGGKLNMGDTASLYSHIKGTKPLY